MSSISQHPLQDQRDAYIPPDQDETISRAKDAVLMPSIFLSNTTQIRGFLSTGFQATNIAYAIEEIKRMRKWRLSDVPVAADEDDDLRTAEARGHVKCKIFLAYTSNLVSAGLRETIRFLAQYHMIDVIVTTAGGVEEDIIKCLAPTHLGDFHLKGAELRRSGLNRIGNLLVPNENYCKFEDWLTPILQRMAHEQINQGVRWTPSKIIARLGQEINHPDSIYYWCARHHIPVFCPALTDGSLGDMLYFFTYKCPDFCIDILADLRLLNDHAVRARATGMIILGGGLVKHHTCNANLMRNGADYAVFINTGQEFDGSDSGARPDEAVSWGKVRIEARPVKVYCDATIAFPLIVSQTFAKEIELQLSYGIEGKNENQNGYL